MLTQPPAEFSEGERSGEGKTRKREGQERGGKGVRSAPRHSWLRPRIHMYEQKHQSAVCVYKLTTNKVQ